MQCLSLPYCWIYTLALFSCALFYCHYYCFFFFYLTVICQLNYHTMYRVKIRVACCHLNYYIHCTRSLSKIDILDILISFEKAHGLLVTKHYSRDVIASGANKHAKSFLDLGGLAQTRII